MRLAIAKRPVLGDFFQSCCHSNSVLLLALLLALDRVTLNGIWRPSDVASLASSSALSLPRMSQWLGHQDIVMVKLGWFSRRGRIVWWNCREKYWAGPGLGSAMAVMEAALSANMCILSMLGKSFRRVEALVALIDSAAISASKTSACPPNPSFPDSTSLPR